MTEMRKRLLSFSQGSESGGRSVKGREKGKGSRPPGGPAASDSSWGGGWGDTENEKWGWPAAAPGAAEAKEDDAMYDGEDDVILAMIKLLLTNSMEIKELQAAVLTVVMLPTEHPLVAAVEKAIKEYMEAGHNENKGPPFIYVWSAIVETMQSREKVPDRHKLTLTEHLKSIEGVQEANGSWSVPAMKPEEICEVVRCCRLKKTFKSTTRRLIFMAHDNRTHTAMKAALIADGATLKMGKAPLGQLERFLSNAVSKRQKQKKDKA